MGLLTFIGFLMFFVIGALVGVTVENQHQEAKRKQASIDYWRWAKSTNSIEQQMLKDGWKL
jgi:hypothetical protein